MDTRVGPYTVFAFEGADLNGTYIGTLNPIKGSFYPMKSPNGTVSIVAVNSLSQGLIIARTEDNYNKFSQLKKKQRFLKTDMQEHSVSYFRWEEYGIAARPGC